MLVQKLTHKIFMQQQSNSIEAARWMAAATAVQVTIARAHPFGHVAAEGPPSGLWSKGQGESIVKVLAKEATEEREEEKGLKL